MLITNHHGVGILRGPKVRRGGTNGAWGPHPRRPGPTCPDGSLGIWGSILQDTWSDVREAAVRGEWLHLPPDALMRRREEEVA